MMHMEAGTHLRDFVALGQTFCRENPSWGSNDGAANANLSLRYAATLADASEVFYQMGDFYHPELARGMRWNDPAFAIPWPAAPAVISDRDATWPDVGPDHG